MDTLIYTHFYSLAAFATTKYTVGLIEGEDFLSLCGIKYGMVAYMATFGYKIYTDINCRKSAYTLALIAKNYASQKRYGESKTKNKPVRKMRRPTKRLEENKNVLDEK